MGKPEMKPGNGNQAVGALFRVGAVNLPIQGTSFAVRHGVPEGLAHHAVGARITYTGLEKIAAPTVLRQPIQRGIGVPSGIGALSDLRLGALGFFLGSLRASTATTLMPPRPERSTGWLCHQRAWEQESHATGSVLLGQWFT